MSFRKIHLRKLLRAFGSTEKELNRLIREDIRTEVRKENNFGGSGGDFHTPFWADAKDFVIVGSGLEERTQSRIESSPQKKRLYPELCKGFIDWWESEKRFTNEKIELLTEPISEKMEFEGLQAAVKFENFMGLKFGDAETRLIYPYFSEEPELSTQNARLGLWALSAAFPQYPISNFHILDILRSASFSVDDCPLTGGEENTFKDAYAKVLKRWDELREEY